MKGLISLAYLEMIGLTSKNLQLFSKVDSIQNIYENDKETLIEFLKFAMNYTFSARSLLTRIHGTICYYQLENNNNLDALDWDTKLLIEETQISRELDNLEALLFACAKKLEFSCDFEYTLLDFSKLKPLHNVERFEFVVKLIYCIRFLATKINEFLGLNIDLDLIDLTQSIKNTISKDYGISFSITDNIDEILNLEREV